MLTRHRNGTGTGNWTNRKQCVLGPFPVSDQCEYFCAIYWDPLLSAPFTCSGNKKQRPSFCYIFYRILRGKLAPSPFPSSLPPPSPVNRYCERNGARTFSKKPSPGNTDPCISADPRAPKSYLQPQTTAANHLLFDRTTLLCDLVAAH